MNEAPKDDAERAFWDAVFAAYIGTADANADVDGLVGRAASIATKALAARRRAFT